MDVQPTIVRLLLVVPLLAAGIVLNAPRMASAATVCDTGSEASRSDVIKDSVVVLAGTTCNLVGAVVRGGVTVEPGATFQAVDGTEIRGSVTTTAPFGINLSGAVVRGDARFVGGPELMNFFEVRSTEVRGNLVVTGVFASINSANIWLTGNTVRGRIDLRGNTARQAVVVQGNAIGVNLDCSGNAPEPIQGGGNTVGGAATGQCSGLVGP